MYQVCRRTLTSRLAPVFRREVAAGVVEVDVVEGRPREADRLDADPLLIQRGEDPGQGAVSVLHPRDQRASLAAALRPGADALEDAAGIVHAAVHQLEVHGVAAQGRLQLAGRSLDDDLAAADD